MSSSKSNLIGLDEVKKHQEAGDCWIIVHDGVYDVTQYASKHPGGAKLIVRNGGKDATQDFEAMYHSSKARNILEQLRVGTLEGSTPGRPSSLNPAHIRRGPTGGPYAMRSYGQPRPVNTATSSASARRKYGGPKSSSTTTANVARRKYGAPKKSDDDDAKSPTKKRSYLARRRDRAREQVELQKSEALANSDDDEEKVEKEEKELIVSVRLPPREPAPPPPMYSMMTTEERSSQSPVVVAQSPPQRRLEEVAAAGKNLVPTPSIRVIPQASLVEDVRRPLQGKLTED
jgi:predicted heme/steroid binding protein